MMQKKTTFLTCLMILAFTAAAYSIDAQTHPPRLGIDISEHSGAVDWNGFDKARFAFVYLKATEGVDLADKAFQNHWLESEKRGIPRGAYHFFVTEDDPAEQATFFIQTVGDDCGDIPPVLDIELLGHNTQGELAPKLLIWLQKVEKAYGVKPVIYTSPRFWNEHVRSDLSVYPLWVAEYEVEAPRLPRGWSNWTFWQYRENIPLKWVEKGADLSRIHPEHDPIRKKAP